MEYLLKNARIIDPGSGKDFTGTLGLSDGKIVFVAQDNMDTSFWAQSQNPVLDLQGKIIAPGFIDLHAHTDLDISGDNGYDDDGVLGKVTLGDASCAERLLSQGVTLALSGNCGLSPLNIGNYITASNQTPYPIHQALQIGHGALRARAGIHDDHIVANSKQIEIMCEFAAKAFEEGAAGISFGLEYQPATTKEELTALARTAKKYNRLLSIHSRIDGVSNYESVEEVLNLVRDTGVHLQFSHLVYMYLEEKLDEAVSLIKAARAEGYHIGVDSGLYTSWATFVNTAIFEDASLPIWDFTYEDLVPSQGRYQGQHLDKEKFEWVRANEPTNILTAIIGTEHDVETALLLDDVAVTTDIGPANPGTGHPQGSATYPKFLRDFALDSDKFTLVEALRRVSTLPAQTLGLDSKGKIEVGADADLVVFDPVALKPTADFLYVEGANPESPPEGIDYVFVAGEIAYDGTNGISKNNYGKAISF
jgi:N-acyl-D-amino-acid deacylase